jgi:hypothetical protein
MSTPIWKGTDTLVEQVGSGEWEFADKVTFRQLWRGTRTACLANALAKGTLGGGSLSGLRVSRCRIVTERGLVNQLQIDWESVEGASLDGAPELPVDEIDYDFERQDRRVEDHPNYTTGVTALTKEQYAAVRAYLDAPDDKVRAANAWILSNTTAANLVEKLSRGNDSYLLSLPTVTYSSYYDTLPALNGEVVREDPPVPPFDSGVVSAYEWIRLGDRVTLGANYWKVTSTWLGAPEWDADLYP